MQPSEQKDSPEEQIPQSGCACLLSASATREPDQLGKHIAITISSARLSSDPLLLPRMPASAVVWSAWYLRLPGQAPASAPHEVKVIQRIYPTLAQISRICKPIRHFAIGLVKQDE